VHDWVGPLILVAMGWSAWRARSRDRWLVRELASVPEVDVGELKEGTRVRVGGVVEPVGGDLLAAPYSGRGCLAWTVRIVARDNLQERLERFGAADFVLRGNDGARIVVRASEAELLVAMGDPISVERVGAAAVRRESILTAGERIIVVGTPRREPDPAGIGSYREPPTRLVLAAGAWVLHGESAAHVGVRGRW
jgi:hypothetical protein